MSLRAIPVTHAQANRFVAEIHRHNGVLPTSVMRVGAVDEDGNVVGVAIAGLPKARMSCRLGTLEVNRVCTDGTRNACSFLYGRIARAAKSLGYQRLITYTIEAEDGASLKASGWRLVADEAGGGSWQERRGTGYGGHDEGAKRRWEITLGPDLPEISWPEEDDAQEALFEAVA